MDTKIKCVSMIVLISIINLCLCSIVDKQSDDQAQMNEFNYKNNKELIVNDLDNQLNDVIDRNENYLINDYLNDGEVERRISYNGIIAKETSIANSG